MPVPTHMIVSRNYEKKVYQLTNAELIALAMAVVKNPKSRVSMKSREFVTGVFFKQKDWLSPKQIVWMHEIVLSNSPLFWEELDRVIYGL
jgi:hypothetical protein